MRRMNELVLKKPITVTDSTLKTITLDMSNSTDYSKVFHISSEELEGKVIKFKLIQNPAIEGQYASIRIDGIIKDACIPCYNHQLNGSDIFIYTDNITVNGSDVNFADLELATGFIADWGFGCYLSYMVENQVEVYFRNGLAIVAYDREW